MDYVITVTRKNDTEVISRHKDLESAMEAGNKFWDSFDSKGTVCCIKADIDDNGTVHGRYWLYKTWF